MRVVTGEEMRGIDQVAIQELGIPGVVLMEAAGRGAAEKIAEMLPPPASILIVAGKGNNGGDGYVIHRWLKHWGYECTTIVLAPTNEITGDAAINLEILRRLRGDLREIADEAGFRNFWSGGDGTKCRTKCGITRPVRKNASLFNQDVTVVNLCQRVDQVLDSDMHRKGSTLPIIGNVTNNNEELGLDVQCTEADGLGGVTEFERNTSYNGGAYLPIERRYDLIVDCILGTGLTGEVRGLSRIAIELINQSALPVVAIDIPSGLDAVKGVPLGIAVEAEMTVTFALPKLGLLLDAGQRYIGQLHVIDIGIPEQAVDQVVERSGVVRSWMNAAICRDMLPVRPADGHKGTFGRVLVLAGSRGMTGAAALTSEAALRSGAGLVTLGIPESLNQIMEVKLTEAMTYPLPEVNGHLAAAGLDEIRRLVEKTDVVAIGPGVGQTENLSAILAMLLQECEKPLVIDADGLNNLVHLLPLLKKRSVLTVLTPHPGEMARLTGLEIPAVQRDRVGIATRFAAEFGVILVLKGSPTITAFPDGRLYINSTGNEGMGTGGSGDVLTGVISGMLAQRQDDISVPAAVYVHGLAGDEEVARANHRSMIAGDLLRGLALAFRKLENQD